MDCSINNFLKPEKLTRKSMIGIGLKSLDSGHSVFWLVVGILHVGFWLLTFWKLDKSGHLQQTDNLCPLMKSQTCLWPPQQSDGQFSNCKSKLFDKCQYFFFVAKKQRLLMTLLQYQNSFRFRISKQFL